MTLLSAFVNLLVFTRNSTSARSLLPYSPCQIQIGPIKLEFGCKALADAPKCSLWVVGLGSLLSKYDRNSSCTIAHDVSNCERFSHREIKISPKQSFWQVRSALFTAQLMFYWSSSRNHVPRSRDEFLPNQLLLLFLFD